jgi:hypothetical protein
LFSAVDPDAGKIAEYQFKDGNSNIGTGYFQMKNKKMPSGEWFKVKASSLKELYYVGGSEDGDENLQIKASDGKNWSEDTSLKIATKPLLGKNVIDIAKNHLGEEYFYGEVLTKADYNQEGYAGPWDCAEFVSWCVYQAYGMEIGFRKDNDNSWSAWTKYWSDDASAQQKLSFVEDFEEAKKIPGAIIFKDPPSGHVAISMGDGKLIHANVDFRNGKYWDDDGNGYLPVNKNPPQNVDTGDVRIDDFSDYYSKANGYEAVVLKGVDYPELDALLS